MVQHAGSLTPAIVFDKTELPFPYAAKAAPASADGGEGVDEPTILWDENRHLRISVCSEFTEKSAISSPFGPQHRIVALRSPHDGLPIVISVGSDHRLWCIRRSRKGHAWQGQDITPKASDTAPDLLATAFDAVDDTGTPVTQPTDTAPKYLVTAFDAAQDTQTNAIQLIVAVAAVNDPEDLVAAHSLVFSALDVAFLEEQCKPAWSFRPCNLDLQSGKRVSALRLTNRASSPRTLPFALVGTQSDLMLTAAEYIVTLDPTVSEAWSHHDLPYGARDIFEVLPGTLTINDAVVNGTLSLVQDATYSEKWHSHLGDEAGNMLNFVPFDQHSLKGIPLDLQTLGGAALDFVNIPNDLNDSDVVVAGVGAVGFYMADKLDQPPVIAFAKKDVAFKQIVAAQTALTISILAVTQSGKLYFMEGKRNELGGVPVFASSGMPIRNGVRYLAVSRNGHLDATDCLYVDDTGHLKHLWRSPGGYWSEQKIGYDMPSAEPHIFPCYISRVVLTDEERNSVASEYTVELVSSEVVYVDISGANRTLSADPTRVAVGMGGTITIVIPTSRSWTAPELRMICKYKDKSFTCNIQPAQRVLRQMALVESEESLASSTNTRGGQTIVARLPKEKHKAAAPLLKNLKVIFSTAIPDAAKELGDDIVYESHGLKQKVDLAWEKVGQDWQQIKDPNTSWSEKAEDVFHLLGDVLESVGETVLATQRFLFKLSEGIWFFVVEIGGAVFRFVLQTVAAALRCIAPFLRDVLGIDLDAFLDWVGYLSDWDNIRSTTSALSDSAQHFLEWNSDVVKQNNAWFKAIIKASKTWIRTIIPDYREPESPESKGKSVFAWLESIFGEIVAIIFDNPITALLLELLGAIRDAIWSALTEVYDIEVPPLQQLSDVLKEDIDKLGNLFSDAILSLGPLLTGFVKAIVDYLNDKITLGQLILTFVSDSVWTIFDNVAKLLELVIDAVPELITVLSKVLVGVWKLPYITRLWKFWTGMEMTIMNAVMLPIAFVTNINWSIIHEDNSLPFADEANSPWRMLPPVEDCILSPNSIRLLELHVERYSSRSSGDRGHAEPSGPESAATNSALVTLATSGHRNASAMAALDVPSPAHTKTDHVKDTQNQLKPWRRVDACSALAGALCGLALSIIDGLDQFKEPTPGDAPPASPTAPGNLANGIELDELNAALGKFMTTSAQPEVVQNFKNWLNKGRWAPTAKAKVEGWLLIFTSLFGFGSFATQILSFTLFETQVWKPLIGQTTAAEYSETLDNIIQKSVGIVLSGLAFGVGLIADAKRCHRDWVGICRAITNLFASIVAVAAPGIREWVELDDKDSVQEDRIRVTSVSLEIVSRSADLITSIISCFSEGNPYTEACIAAALGANCLVLTSEIGIYSTLEARYQNNQGLLTSAQLAKAVAENAAEITVA